MDRTDVEEISTHLGRLSKLTGGACLFMALRGANRARETELRVGFRERFPGIRFDEGLLVRSAMNSLSTSSAISASAAWLDAIAHPCGRRDSHIGRFALSALKMGFTVERVGEDSRSACTGKLITPELLFDVQDGYGAERKGAVRDAVFKPLGGSLRWHMMVVAFRWWRCL